VYERKKHEKILMRMVLAICVMAMVCSFFCGCNRQGQQNNIDAGQEMAADDYVRNACFDEYHNNSNYKGKLLGLIFREFKENSFVSSPDGSMYLWDLEYSVNNDIDFLYSPEISLEYNSQKEDLVCVTLAEHIDYEENTDTVLNYIFSVDKSTKTVLPVAFVGMNDGIVDHIIYKNTQSYTPAMVADHMFMMLKYLSKDIEYLKENVY